MVKQSSGNLKKLKNLSVGIECDAGVADNWLRSINLHKNIVFVLLLPKRYEAHGSLRLSCKSDCHRQVGRVMLGIYYKFILVSK
jgi:hypothetical protein